MILIASLFIALVCTAYVAVAIHYGTFMARDGEFRGIGLIAGAATWPIWFIMAVCSQTRKD